MKDRLEQKIRDNKQEFDFLEPDAHLWDNISGQLETENATRDYSWLWKVAALVFLISTISLLFIRDFSGEEPSEQFLSDNEGYNSELIEVESYYVQLIAEKRKEIIESDVQNAELLAEIDVLDSMYSELKTDLKKNHEDTRLMNAMIRNLQLRVEILNRQINILEHIQTVKENENISI